MSDKKGREGAGGIKGEGERLRRGGGMGFLGGMGQKMGGRAWGCRGLGQRERVEAGG